MLIALASGKGGVGKTTVSVNLALSFAQKGVSTQLLDCDVEEPDCHLYLKPTISSHEPVTVLVPSVDESRCNYCGQCSRLCAYGAIICLPNKIDVFPELCHSCGGCALVCEQAAITEKPREIGTIEEGHCDELAFAHGFLKIGEIRAVSVIADLIQRGRKNNKEITIIDAPPGTSCPVVEAVKDCDFLCLVTEPTRFGLHDLEMAVDVGRALNRPMGIVVNRSGLGDDRALQFCREKNIPLLAEIPDDRELAELHTRGGLAVRDLPRFAPIFQSLADKIQQQVLA